MAAHQIMVIEVIHADHAWARGVRHLLGYNTHDEVIACISRPLSATELIGNI
jgi:hypothetical protein